MRLVELTVSYQYHSLRAELESGDNLEAVAADLRRRLLTIVDGGGAVASPAPARSDLAAQSPPSVPVPPVESPIPPPGGSLSRRYRLVLVPGAAWTFGELWIRHGDSLKRRGWLWDARSGCAIQDLTPQSAEKERAWMAEAGLTPEAV